MSDGVSDYQRRRRNADRAFVRARTVFAAAWETIQQQYGDGDDAWILMELAERRARRCRAYSSKEAVVAAAIAVIVWGEVDVHPASVAASWAKALAFLIFCPAPDSIGRGLDAFAAPRPRASASQHELAEWANWVLNEIGYAPEESTDE